MSFYRDTIRKARKQHACELCGAIIKVGDEYHDKSSNEFGDIFNTKECKECQPFLNEFVSSGAYDPDTGYNENTIHDWWIEEKCETCEHRLLFYHDECELTHYCRCENFKKE